MPPRKKIKQEKANPQRRKSTAKRQPSPKEYHPDLNKFGSEIGSQQDFRAAKEFYNDESFGSLVRSFKIPSEHVESLRRALNQAALLFASSASVATNARQQIAIRTNLQGILDAQQHLVILLNGLSDLDRDRLWHPLWEDPNRPPINIIGFAVPFHSGEFQGEFQLRETLNAFGRRLRARLEDLKAVTDRGGRPERTDLRVWMAHIRDFWTETLHRKFSIHVLKGVQPKSQALRFCRLAVNPLAKDITNAQLITAMRIAQRNLKATIFISSELHAPKNSEKPRRPKRRVTPRKNS